MSRSISACALAALALLCSVLLARAQQVGTADQARRMIEAAVAALKDNEASALDKVKGFTANGSTPAIFMCSASTCPTAHLPRNLNRT